MSREDRELHLISINHTNASAETRMALDLSVLDWFNLEAFARFSLGVVGWVKISTCNRIEILIDAPATLDIGVVLKKWNKLSKKNIPYDQFDVISGNSEVIQYLLELSTGLRSAIYGDDQILSQIKESFESSRSASTGLSTLIERAYQCLMRCHKQITGDTEFKNQGVSLAYHGLRYTRDYFKDKGQISNKCVLIIGAGNMAEQVVKYISKFSFEQVYITNRTIQKAQLLIEDKDIVIVPYDELSSINPDIVVSCTEQGVALGQEYFEPELIIDYSLSKEEPRSDVSILDLKSMQRALDNRNAISNNSISDVKDIIIMHSTSYTTWADQWQLRNSR